MKLAGYTFRTGRTVLFWKDEHEDASFDDALFAVLEEFRASREETRSARRLRHALVQEIVEGTLALCDRQGDPTTTTFVGEEDRDA